MAQAAAPNTLESQRLSNLREGQTRDRRMQQRRGIAANLVRGAILSATIASAGVTDIGEPEAQQTEMAAQEEEEPYEQQLAMRQQPSRADRVTQAFSSIWQNLQNLRSRTVAQVEKTTELETLKTFRGKTDTQLDKLARNAGKIKVRKQSKATADNFFKGFSQVRRNLTDVFNKKEKLLKEIQERDEKNDLLSKEAITNPFTAIPWFNVQLLWGYMVKKGQDKKISPPTWRFLEIPLLPDSTARGAILFVDGMIGFLLFLSLVQLLFLIILVYIAYEPAVLSELVLGLLGPVSNFLYGFLPGL